MNTSFTEMIGTPSNKGFATFIDWRAQMAATNTQLLRDSLCSIDAAKLDLKFYLEQADINEWLNFFSHPLTLTYIAENNSQANSNYTTEKLFLHTLNSIKTFNSYFNSLANNENILVLKTSPETPVILDTLKMKGKGSRRDDCLSAELITTKDKYYEAYCNKINQALNYLQSECSGYYSDVTKSLQYIVLTKSASFRGSSSLYHIGLAYFCPDPDWTVEKWAEELVHESSHQLLEYILYQNKAFTSDDAISEIKFNAPLRNDVRPAYGTYHALFVVCRISSFYLNSNALDKKSLPYVHSIVSKSISIYKDLIEYEHLSNIGRQILENYIYPTLNNNYHILTTLDDQPKKTQIREHKPQPK